MTFNRNSKQWCAHYNYGFIWALGSVFLTFILRLALQPILFGSLPLFFFQVNTILITFFFGFWPALLTMALSLPLMIFFFLPPFNQLSPLEAQDITTIFVYFGYTITISILIELLRREQYNSQMSFLVSESRFKMLLDGDIKIRSLLKSGSGLESN